MSEQTLERFRWRNRLLLVFAPSAGDPRLAEQIRRVAAEHAAFGERDLILLEILAQGENPAAVPPREDAAAIRARFGVEEAVFAVVLVGKDGTEKGRWAEPAEMRELWALIDTMPMRRREMAEREG